MLGDRISDENFHALGAACCAVDVSIILVVVSPQRSAAAARAVAGDQHIEEMLAVLAPSLSRGLWLALVVIYHLKRQATEARQ